MDDLEPEDEGEMLDYADGDLLVPMHDLGRARGSTAPSDLPLRNPSLSGNESTTHGTLPTTKAANPSSVCFGNSLSLFLVKKTNSLFLSWFAHFYSGYED